ncbi:RNA polymerase sigma factor RpoD/SigA [Streptomyces sp. OV198]|uniref:sigma-70 family RNA polymerase sigma factor n=1 Tax=Streptomyces sp. OV198 TaxID=1882787 RepID=UPI0015CF597A|nr:sigma-70 family RNA polymerase sigma factor [Streptomyces sp. OV198]
MRAQSVGGAGAFGMKAALAELLVQLRSAAVDGVVPERVFAESVRVFELGDTERDRLRDELARMGLPVQGVHVHIDADSGDVEKVARIREENVFPRVEVVRALLSRYADVDGYVTARVVDGVVRLAGLNAREAAALRAGAPLREAAAGVDAPLPSEGPESELPGPSESLEPMGEPEPSEPEGLETAQAGGDLAAAVTAARAVLAEDRFRRRPEDHFLSAEAEVGLAVLVRGGASRLAREPEKRELSVLPVDDTRVLARNCLVLHNQRLVHSLLRGFLEQGLDYDDLFQHGVLGLMTAARKFDPAKGYKFSTYATWWIRQAVTRAIADEGAVIRIPVHMHEQIRKVAKAERTLIGQGKPAGPADVAVLCDLSLQKVEEARRLSRRTDSLDRVVGDGVTLGDFVGRRSPLPSVERTVLDALTAEQVMAVVDTFTGRDHRILVRRLGLDGDEPSTLDELGREVGVTRERIRQIEVKLRPMLKMRLRAAGLFGPGEAPREEEAGDGPPDGARAHAQAGRPAGAHVSVVRAVKEPVKEEAVAGTLPEASSQVADATGDSMAATEIQASSAADLDPEAAPAITRHDSPSVALAAPDSVHTVDAEISPSTATSSQGREAAVCEQGDATASYTADWGAARRVAAAPAEGVPWLAEYALAAVGQVQLTALLGQSATDVVLRAARGGESVDRPVGAALEVLRRVFDVLGESGHRPEDFFERPAEALVDITPRAYLARKPLVHSESRLAVRDALREFITEVGRQPGHVEETERVEDTEHTERTEEMDREETVTEARLAEVQRVHEADVERLRQEHRQRIEEERQASTARLAAVRADIESEMDAWEAALLGRMDKALLRREQFVRDQAEERIALLTAEHHEAHRTVIRRAEQAEEVARAIAGDTDLYRQRAQAADERLRHYREDAEARIAALEARLRNSESRLTQQDQAVRVARQRAETAEERATQRIAQTERDAWARISELQEQLAAERGIASGPSWLRDHRGRS